MTRTLGNRRAVLVTGIAAFAAVAFSACSTGQVAETSNKVPSVYGINSQNSDASVLIRSLAVAYSTVKGYAAGENAPLEISLYNQSEKPVTVTISAGQNGGPGIVGARSVTLSAAAGTAPSPTGALGPNATAPNAGLPSASAPVVGPNAIAPNAGAPSASAPVVSPAAAPGASAAATPSTAAPGAATGASVQPATVTLAPLGSAVFRRGGSRVLQVAGLTGELRAGNAVSLTFSFDNGAAPLSLNAPVAVPLQPVPRGSAEVAPQEPAGH